MDNTGQHRIDMVAEGARIPLHQAVREILTVAQQIAKDSWDRGDGSYAFVGMDQWRFKRLKAAYEADALAAGTEGAAGRDAALAATHRVDSLVRTAIGRRFTDAGGVNVLDLVQGHLRLIAAALATKPGARDESDVEVAARAYVNADSDIAGTIAYANLVSAVTAAQGGPPGRML